MKKFITLNVGLLLTNILIKDIFAQNNTPCVGYGDDPCKNTGAQSFGNAFSITIQIVLFVFALLALFRIIQGALKYINSGGDPKQVDNAQKEITWAVVGLVLTIILFAVYGLLLTITGIGTTGPNGFQFIIPTFKGLFN